MARQIGLSQTRTWAEWDLSVIHTGRAQSASNTMSAATIWSTPSHRSPNVTVHSRWLTSPFSFYYSFICSALRWTNLTLDLFIQRDRDIPLLLAEEGSRNRGSIQIALGGAVWWEPDEIIVWIWRTQRKLSETVRINLIWALGSKAGLWAAQYF